ncbi:DUF11 domain-containing protein [Conexibacter woesei]|uniref:DUF11 domain-containing protein n=1 Tax=Conexibacter woesei TaxID=191495 RepID=UPI0004225274|nr:DUF11 domain-containing protein [Conexibacter woesei]
MRTTRTLATTAAAALTILACAAAAAQADPGKVSTGDLTVTTSDTTPAPGETITIGVDYVVQTSDLTAVSANMGFGSYTPPPQIAVNLADLSFVSGSCTGDFSGCTYNPAITDAFDARVPAPPPGRTVSGTAQFTVSSSATNGETIAFAGHHESQLLSGGTSRNGTPLLRLTVRAPPEADLGVDLSATASLLNPRVSYDAAVTNNGPAAATSATITTQLPSQATGISSSTCTYASGTDQVSCPIGALADGATTHATFTATYGLLTIGLPLHATATRTASAPTDPNASNDSDSADCNAITSLLITC